jgi:transcriptional regulator NrdR family protein
MKCNCGGKTEVMQTMPIQDTVKRRRKCVDCKKLMHTLEVRAEVLEMEPEPPKPEPVKPMAKVAKTIHQKRVDTRRTNEDRRNRVPNYFIEEDEY